MNLLDLLDRSLFGNPLRDWGISTAILVATVAALFLVRSLLRGRLQTRRRTVKRLVPVADRSQRVVSRHRCDGHT